MNSLDVEVAEFPPVLEGLQPLPRRGDAEVGRHPAGARLGGPRNASYGAVVLVALPGHGAGRDGAPPTAHAVDSCLSPVRKRGAAARSARALQRRTSRAHAAVLLAAAARRLDARRAATISELRTACKHAHNTPCALRPALELRATQ